MKIRDKIKSMCENESENKTLNYQNAQIQQIIRPK